MVQPSRVPLGAAYLGSSLPQEANARAAIRRKRSLVCFILLICYSCCEVTVKGGESVRRGRKSGGRG